MCFILFADSCFSDYHGSQGFAVAWRADRHYTDFVDHILAGHDFAENRVILP